MLTLAGCSEELQSATLNSDSGPINSINEELGSSNEVQVEATATTDSSLDQSDNPSAETDSKIEPVDLVEKLVSVANASCELALAEGVVEASSDPAGFTLVMVPKSMGIDGYSAAYFLPPETYELIWETDVFYACELANSFSLASDAGTELEIDVSLDAATGEFLVTQDFGEWGVSATKYEVTDGLLRAATNLNSEGETYRIEYGFPNDIELQILVQAVELFMQE